MNISSGDGRYSYFKTADVVSTLQNRPSSVSVGPDIFNMTFKGNIMTACFPVVVLWHAGIRIPTRAGSQKSFPKVYMIRSSLVRCPWVLEVK